jgi:threonine-phosphate decarboxylase
MIGGHGGNIYELAQRLGCRPADISDMSANVNPLGPMPALMAHLMENLSRVAALPEVDAGSIINDFSRFHDIDPSLVMAGNGTTELIYLIPRVVGARKALVVGPTYSDYRDACAMHAVPCDHLICSQENDFTPDLQAIERRAAETDLVFLCNPNNPTGTLTNRNAIEGLCRALPQTTFVIDESYLPFAPQAAQETLIHSDLPNVMVLNSMSKAFRIPGLRIGFVKAPMPLMEKLTPFTLPWSVNSLAQTAVAWLMTHPDPVNEFLASSRTLLAAEKAEMIAHVHRETDIRCFPSATSFILMRLPGYLNAPAVWRYMADRRILVRDCANFTGLSEAFIRIALKSEPENRRAADLLVRLCRDNARTERSHGH